MVLKIVQGKILSMKELRVTKGTNHNYFNGRGKFRLQNSYY